jgi:hypothetical protein
MRKRVLITVLAAALAAAAAETPQRAAAQRELFSAHWTKAADLYREILRNDPAWGSGWDALVCALLEARRPAEAYQAAEQALKSAPNTAGAYTAQGRAFLRQGRLAEAELSFRKATELDPKYPCALAAQANLFHAVAKFKTERRLRKEAYESRPDDPELIVGWAEALKGPAHIEALRRALAIYDPDTPEAERLRAHIATDAALGDRRPWVLASPYRACELNLQHVLHGPRDIRGAGLRVRLNDSYEVNLLLDTAGRGVWISRKAAAKAKLQLLTQQNAPTRGAGSRQTGSMGRYLARSIRAGDVELRNCLVSTYDNSKTADRDGIIGMDVFSDFLIQLDWPHMKLRLSPYPGLTAPPEEFQDASDTPPAGFERFFIFAAPLLPVSVNDGTNTLFVVDSGADVDVADLAIARAVATVIRSGGDRISRDTGSPDDVYRAARMRLTFANFRQGYTNMLAVDLSRTSEYVGVQVGGFFGTPLLSQFVITVNYREAAIRFDYKGAP